MEKGHLPSFNQALLCFAVIMGIIIVGVVAFKASIHVLLMISIIWTCCLTYFLGYNFTEIKQIMSNGISMGLGAIYVFILIGVVIATYLESGTIASLVYYSLDLIHPAVFLPAGLLICAFMSVAVGTMMGTVATAGVILIGVGDAMGIPLPIVAGMIIAGASFGDKMSPISDTTNLAAVVAGTDLYKHIKSMLYTTVPTFIICLIIFTFIGFQYSDAALSRGEIEMFQAAIDDNFSVSFWTLLPILTLLVLSLNRVQAEPAMLASVVVAILLALILQDRNFLDVIASIHGGYRAETGHAQLDMLVNRGGIVGMMGITLLALFVLALGGLLDAVGYLTSLLKGLFRKLESVLSLMVATMFTGIIATISTGQGYISIVLASQLFRQKYEEMGLQKYMLSRTVEESTTLVAPLLPWSLGGAFYAVTLGVPVFDYLPWAFLNYLNVFVSVAMAMMGLAIFRVAREKNENS